MGMDYGYAGSATYSRFFNELRAVANVFGGIETENLQERFVFPKGTNEILVRWFNNIYGEDFTVEETKVVWECVLQHPEIKNISRQIWCELEMLDLEEEAWYITR